MINVSFNCVSAKDFLEEITVLLSGLKLQSSEGISSQETAAGAREGAHSTSIPDFEAVVEEIPSGETEAQKTKRKRRTKIEMEAARGESQLPAEEDVEKSVLKEVSVQSEDAPPAKKLFEARFTEWTSEDFKGYAGPHPEAEPTPSSFMRDLLQKLVDKNGMDSAREFLVGLGMGSVGKITEPGDQQRFLDAIDAELM